MFLGLVRLPSLVPVSLLLLAPTLPLACSSGGSHETTPVSPEAGDDAVTHADAAPDSPGSTSDASDASDASDSGTHTPLGAEYKPIGFGACLGSSPTKVTPQAPTQASSAVCAQLGTPPPVATSLATITTTLVGRWVACGATLGFASATGSAGAVGLEFGGNGRWRELAQGAAGLVPLQGGKSGTTVVTPTPGGEGGVEAWVYFEPDWGDGTEWQFEQVALTADGNGLVFERTTPAAYARVVAAADNGDSNPPSVSNGSCSMSGTWDVTVQGKPTQTMTFDDDGNWFVGGPTDDACLAERGRYELDPSFFLVTQAFPSACLGGAGLSHVAFDASCSSVTLTGYAKRH
jgi:hypothetical protein